MGECKGLEVEMEMGLLDFMMGKSFEECPLTDGCCYNFSSTHLQLLRLLLLTFIF